MADTKLSALTAATPAPADLVYLVQNGNSRRATAQGVANLAPGTNLLYVAATRLLSSSTGDDVVLPLFTSSLAGLVSPSGGGDVNFLRADGVWAAPPSSATDLSYNASTRLLSSSTGADVTLPLATDALPGLLAASDKARLDQLGVDDSPTFAGLTITGTAAVEIPHIHGDLAGKVYAHVRNATGVSIAALVPYHVTGAHGDTDAVTIEPAQGSNPALMPAAGITYEAIASNASGHGVVAGVITNVNTAGLTAGDALYVASGGGLTATRPTSGLVQVVAIVGRVHASTGTIVVALGSVLPSPADATPAALGAAAIGSSIDYAREDHVHAMPTAADVGAAAVGPVASSGLTMATARILGRSTTGSGAVEELALGAGVVLDGTTLRADQMLGIACSDESSNLTAGTAKVTFRMPYAATLLGCKAEVNTAPTGANLVVDINKDGTSILSTKLSIDAGEETSETAATPPVISDAALANDAKITIDIDQIGSTAAGKGLKIWLYLRRTG